MQTYEVWTDRVHHDHYVTETWTTDSPAEHIKANKPGWQFFQVTPIPYTPDRQMPTLGTLVGIMTRNGVGPTSFNVERFAIVQV